MDKRILQIADHYGYDVQSSKTIEECAELICAVAHKDLDNILEELADVQIMIWQMTALLCCGGALDDEIEYKIERTIKRMEDENNGA